MTAEQRWSEPFTCPACEGSIRPGHVFEEQMGVMWPVLCRLCRGSQLVRRRLPDDPVEPAEKAAIKGGADV